MFAVVVLSTIFWSSHASEYYLYEDNLSNKIDDDLHSGDHNDVHGTIDDDKTPSRANMPLMSYDKRFFTNLLLVNPTGAGSKPNYIHTETFYPISKIMLTSKSIMSPVPQNDYRNGYFPKFTKNLFGKLMPPLRVSNSFFAPKVNMFSAVQYNDDNLLKEKSAIKKTYPTADTIPIQTESGIFPNIYYISDTIPNNDGVGVSNDETVDLHEDNVPNVDKNPEGVETSNRIVNNLLNEYISSTLQKKPLYLFFQNVDSWFEKSGFFKPLLTNPQINNEDPKTQKSLNRDKDLMFSIAFQFVNKLNEKRNRDFFFDKSESSSKEYSGEDSVYVSRDGLNTTFMPNKTDTEDHWTDVLEQLIQDYFDIEKGNSEDLEKDNQNGLERKTPHLSLPDTESTRRSKSQYKFYRNLVSPDNYIRDSIEDGNNSDMYKELVSFYNGIENPFNQKRGSDKETEIERGDKEGIKSQGTEKPLIIAYSTVNKKHITYSTVNKNLANDKKTETNSQKNLENLEKRMDLEIGRQKNLKGVGTEVEDILDLAIDRNVDKKEHEIFQEKDKDLELGTLQNIVEFAIPSEDILDVDNKRGYLHDDNIFPHLPEWQYISSSDQTPETISDVDVFGTETDRVPDKKQQLMSPEKGTDIKKDTLTILDLLDKAAEYLLSSDDYENEIATDTEASRNMLPKKVIEQHSRKKELPAENKPLNFLYNILGYRSIGLQDSLNSTPKPYKLQYSSSTDDTPVKNNDPAKATSYLFEYSPEDFLKRFLSMPTNGKKREDVINNNGVNNDSVMDIEININKISLDKSIAGVKNSVTDVEDVEDIKSGNVADREISDQDLIMNVLTL